MDKNITDVTTGKQHSLEHLAPFTTTYDIKVDGNPTGVILRVHFSTHCYTRSIREGDLDDAILYRESKHNGEIDERVFCVSRWEFSKNLPELIKDLHSKGCFQGSGKQFLYRQENQPNVGSHHGWYICIRLGTSEKYQNLTMSVRSAHWRTNRPIGIRGGVKRFYALLSQFYAAEKKKKNWL